MNRTSLRRGCFVLALAVVAGTALAAEPPKPDPSTQFINDYLANQWKLHKLTPAERCTDEEFIRRVSLDLIGRIATVAEVEEYLKDKPETRRARLVDRLLDGAEKEEYAKYWAGLWTGWLMPRSQPRLFQDQLHLWLEEGFHTEMLSPDGKIVPKPHVSHKDMVAQLLTARGQSNNNGGVNFLLAHLGTELPRAQLAEDGMFDMVPATHITLRLFLGYRLVAHPLPDHPIHPDFKPEKFWGVNAFFRQVERDGPPLPKNPNVPLGNPVITLRDNPGFNAKGIVSYSDQDGKHTVGLVFLDGRKFSAEGTKSRRDVLADFVTSHENFAKAYVNRTWGHFFGRGLHERAIVDDFGSHHKAVHPELLDRLAKDFAAGGYNQKRLMRAICASDAYQLKSVTNATNVKEESEIYFSRMPLKVMTPEQVMESLMLTIRRGGNQAAHRKLGVGTRDHIARRLGDAEWDDLPVQDRIIHNVVLINRKELTDALLDSKSGGFAEALALKDPDKIVERMYLTALNRRPTAREQTQINALVLKEGKDAKDQTNLWQDVYWALLNSSEFILNH